MYYDVVVRRKKGMEKFRFTSEEEAIDNLFSIMEKESNSTKVSLETKDKIIMEYNVGRFKKLSDERKIKIANGVY